MAVRALLSVILVILGGCRGSSAPVRWFASADTECQASAHEVLCVTDDPWRTVELVPNGRVTVCRSCRSNTPLDAEHLSAGQRVTVGPYLCTTVRRGIRCVVAPSNHGFELGRRWFRRF